MLRMRAREVAISSSLKKGEAPGKLLERRIDLAIAVA